MVSKPSSDVGGALMGVLLAAALASLLSGLFIMLGSNVLHGYFPVVPAFSYLESLILGAMWSSLFMRVSD